MDDYKTLGSFAAMSIVQGGPGFPFLHPHVYMYLCSGKWSPTLIPPQAIPDYAVRDFVEKVITRVRILSVLYIIFTRSPQLRMVKS